MTVRIALALLILAIPATGLSQDRGATVGGSVSVMNTYAQPVCPDCVISCPECHSDVAFAGTVGYRFTRIFSTEIEVTAVPDRTSLDGDLALPLPLNRGATVGNRGGWVVIYTSNVDTAHSDRLIVVRRLPTLQRAYAQNAQERGQELGGVVHQSDELPG